MNTVILTALVSTSVLFSGSLMLNNNDCNERMDDYYQSESSFKNNKSHMRDSDYESMTFDYEDNDNYSNMHMRDSDYESMMFDFEDDDNYNNMHMNSEYKTTNNSHMNGGSSMHGSNGHGMRN